MFVAHFDALMTGVMCFHIKQCGLASPLKFRCRVLAVCFPWWVWTKPKLGAVWLWMENYYLSWQCFMWESSTPVIRHQNVQQTFTTEKRNKLKCVLSLSLSHTHTHTHTQLHIHAQSNCNPTVYVYSMYIECCCSVGTFGEKFLCIFDTFVFLNTLFLFY